MRRVLLVGCGLVGLSLGLSSCSDDGPPGGEDLGSELQDFAGTAGNPDIAPPADSCEAFGHYPAPVNTFTLPAGQKIISYTDIQKSFPAVDWTTLDRLYVPAGSYTTFQIGNLPVREASRPLVITNLDGQVKVGPNLGGNFIWSMGGGANWILSGRYDPDAKTGDPQFPGHRCGKYAGSRGTYGFLSDDQFDTSGPYLHMGLSITDTTAIELEYLEIANSGFAGVRMLNGHEAGKLQAMDDVRVHDLYIHDTNGEGVYFGWTGAPPSSLFHRLTFYNNRIVRTGNEALQVQDLADGTKIYNNVFAYGGLFWLFNGLGAYQDHNAQILTREGTILVENNVFLRGPSQVLSFFTSPQTGDGDRHVTFHANYFADASTGMLVYLNGKATAGSDFTFQGNFFRDYAFDYTQADPAATAVPYLFSANTEIATGLIKLDANTWEGGSQLANGISGGTGSKNQFVLTGNVNGPVEALEFVASGYPAGDAARKLRAWSAKATIQASDPVIQYAVGDLVMYLGQMYRCKASNQDQPPDVHPESWDKLPLPEDDLRVVPGSPYAALGIR